MIMNKFTKHLITSLFVIIFGFAAGSAGAQSWDTNWYSNAAVPNACVAGTCQCPQGWTLAASQTTGENCKTSGDSAAYDGCWNPTGCGGSYTGGQCCTCGSGGTVTLSYVEAYYQACFGGSGGQQNWSGGTKGAAPNPSGIACTQNSDCVSYNNGVTSGGFAQ